MITKSMMKWKEGETEEDKKDEEEKEKVKVEKENRGVLGSEWGLMGRQEQWGSGTRELKGAWKREGLSLEIFRSFIRTKFG